MENQLKSRGKNKDSSFWHEPHFGKKFVESTLVDLSMRISLRKSMRRANQ